MADYYEYKRHYMLSARGVGPVKILVGRVNVGIYFINDTESVWTENERECFLRWASEAIKKIQRAADSNKVFLQLGYHSNTLTVSKSYSAYANNLKGLVSDALKIYNYRTADEYQDQYRKLYNYNEVPLLFVFNKSRRSFAQCASLGWDNSDEFGVLFWESNQNADHPFAHELLHLFGAKDFYYPEEVKAIAQRSFPSSVMLSRTYDYEIDELTRFLIGWTHELGYKAEQFLKETAHITPEMVSQALKAEWKRWS